MRIQAEMGGVREWKRWLSVRTNKILNDSSRLPDGDAFSPKIRIMKSGKTSIGVDGEVLRCLDI